MNKVKILENKNNNYYSRFYSEDLNYQFNDYSELESGMRILISDEVKKIILIRKINKYFKQKNLDIKIVNDISKANTICVKKEYRPRISDAVLVTDPNTGDMQISWFHKYSPGDPNHKHIKLIDIYYSGINRYKKLFNAKNNSEILDLFSSKYKFVSEDDLIDITKDQYISDSVNIEINSHKLRTMLVQEDTCRILCASLKNRDLSNYISDIIESYYVTDSGKCRSLIKNKLLMRYKESDALVSFGDTHSNSNYKHIYYINTMKKLQLEPSKEFVLQLVGFYK
jgi:hypothetical protein